ncbi:D-alanyl-D-alanine carboxypeptidase, partial [Francisella tularensis subsp. holarctica]|uniref:D-alanyl-D-alanine carboxypeptidase n=1 Tax=Francisella tularensis TaxID=263 RepID=UPI002381BD7F
NRSSKLLKGKVFSKTVTETTVVALSGYLYANNNQYIFSILVNNLKNLQKSSALSLEKDLLESIC